MRGLLIGLCAIVLLTACDDGPNRPSRVTLPGPSVNPPPPPPAPEPGRTFTVSGVVTTVTNVPVDGVRVVVLGQAEAGATTAADGSYSISGVQGSPVELMSPLMSASKSGFFTDVEFANVNYEPITADTRLDFRLAPLVSIAPGETIHGRSPSDNLDCSHWGYGTGPCQRFALTMPASGILEVTLSGTPFNFDLDIVGPRGDFEIYSAIWVSPLRVTIPVHAGSTYEIRVIGGWEPPREFELTTTLK